MGVSVATVKAWMRRAHDPLPAVQVGTSGTHYKVVAGLLTEWLIAEANRTASASK
jgi:hypothetical protein